MRFYHCLPLSALLLIYLLGDNVLGAPTKEPKLMWLKCNNGTCVPKMSTIPRPNQLFPDRETQDMDQVLDSDESSEEELSGEGSGIGFPFFLPSGAQEEKGNHLDDWQQEIEQNVVEGSSGEVNYGNDIIPVKPQLSAQDLELDNVIQ